MEDASSTRKQVASAQIDVTKLPPPPPGTDGDMAHGMSAPYADVPPPDPPPLPQENPDVASGHPAVRGSFTRCFLCDSELEGSSCPTCRMTWVE